MFQIRGGKNSQSFTFKFESHPTEFYLFEPFTLPVSNPIKLWPVRLNKFGFSWDINFLIYTFLIHIISLQIQPLYDKEVKIMFANSCLQVDVDLRCRPVLHAFHLEHMMRDDSFLLYLTLQQHNLVKAWENINVIC